jgi:hypothetical protein
VRSFLNVAEENTWNGFMCCPCVVYRNEQDCIDTMPPCESTLGYINLAHSDSDEKHSSQSPPRDVVGCIIDFIGSDSNGGACFRG